MPDKLIPADKKWKAEALEKKYSFKPIPKAYPFSPNIPVLLGGTHGDQPSYLLCKGQDEIVVEGPPNKEYFSKLDPQDEFYDYKSTVASLQYHADVLEILQTLMDEVNIHFGETNRVFLIKDSRTGQYKISPPKPFVMDRISCPLWAALIPVKDITFTVWGMWGDRRGIWRGKEVDIKYIWRKDELRILDQTMYGYRCAQRHNLDLTFEAYGHVISNDGAVVGLVSEAAWGRMARISDRSLIYSALAKLQAAGCIYRGVDTNRFIIAGDKVRLVELASIFWVEDSRKRDELAEHWHWDAAEKLFQEFEEYGPYGFMETLSPLSRFYMGHEDMNIIPPLPQLRKFIQLWPDFFTTTFVKPWEGYALVEPDETPANGKVLNGRLSSAGPRRGNPLILAEPTSSSRPIARIRRQQPYILQGAIRNFERGKRRGAPAPLSDDTLSTIEEIN